MVFEPVTVLTIEEVDGDWARLEPEWHLLWRELSNPTPFQTFALFSHGDAIRAAICYWLAVPLDLLPRVEIDPASHSVLRLGPEGPRTVSLNVMA